MKIAWEIIESQPEFELLTVKYFNDAGQEMWRNHNPMEWSKESIVTMVEGYAPHVVAFFERTAARAADVMDAIPKNGEVECEAQKFIFGDIPDTIIPDPPEFDEWTQRAEVLPAEVGDPEHEWQVIDLTAEEQQELIDGACNGLRWQRNQLLLESDFFNFPDACVANVQDWLDYRQALRDVPEQPNFPKSFIWPDKPELMKEDID
jgi:hypothetical protein